LLLNYTFICNTPYHVFISYILANLLKITEQNHKYNLVLIGSGLERYSKPRSHSFGLNFQWNSIIHLSKEVIKAEFSAKLFLYNLNTLRIARKQAKAYFKKNKVDYLFVFVDNDAINSLFIQFFNKKNFNGKLILVEEGTSAYINPEYFSQKKWKKSIKSVLKKLFRFPNPEDNPVGENSQPDYCIVSKIDSLKDNFARGAQYIEWPSGLFPRDITLNFIYEYIHELDSEEDLLYQKPLLFITQPLSEDGVISITQEIEYVKIVKKIAEIEGKPVLVKPHPREKKEKIKLYRNFGFTVLDKFKDVPAELLLMIYEPNLVVSVFSSAAINYALRNNGKVLWLERMIVKKKKLEFALLEKLIAEKRVYAPNNMQEMQRILPFLLSCVLVHC